MQNHFDGPLCDLKERQRAGLLVNWLGREATQILASVEVEISTPDEVFQALEKVFRPESNQTLAHFKFRNLKQKSSQTCDSYMSELRLALPECKYRNDADELLKDQFHFWYLQQGDTGPSPWWDKRNRQLCEKSVWGQKDWIEIGPKKMLGIANPGLVSVDAIRNRSTKFKGKSNHDHRTLLVTAKCLLWMFPQQRWNALHLAKLVINVVEKPLWIYCV